MDSDVGWELKLLQVNQSSLIGLIGIGDEIKGSKSSTEWGGTAYSVGCLCVRGWSVWFDQSKDCVSFSVTWTCQDWEESVCRAEHREIRLETGDLLAVLKLRSLCLEISVGIWSLEGMSWCEKRGEGGLIDKRERTNDGKEKERKARLPILDWPVSCQTIRSDPQLHKHTTCFVWKEFVKMECVKRLRIA